MKFLKLINNLAFAGVVLCLPKATVPRALSRRDGTAADTLIIIMPDSASCSGRGDECVTADVAAPFLVESMEKYKVSTGKEQAGILALIAYESQQLRYKKNLLHSADGQGTANEQSGDFNVQFANTIPDLAKLNLTKSNVLDYVTDNKYNFATGAWYYSSQDDCADARTMAANGSTAWEWFSEYMAVCDGVPLALSSDETPDRVAYWNSALTAFGFTNDTTS